MSVITRRPKNLKSEKYFAFSSYLLLLLCTSYVTCNPCCDHRYNVRDKITLEANNGYVV